MVLRPSHRGGQLTLNPLEYPQGFTFDIGPHVSFTSDTRIQEMLAENVGGEYDSHDYKFSNYWKGHWLGHPAQTNLYGLPPQVIVDVIRDFVAQGGRPVDVGSVDQIVIDQQTGLLVPAGNVDALVDRLTRLADDPAEAAAYGRAGRAHILRTYDHNKQLDCLVHLYRRLLLGDSNLQAAVNA